MDLIGDYNYKRAKLVKTCFSFVTKGFSDKNLTLYNQNCIRSFTRKQTDIEKVDFYKQRKQESNSIKNSQNNTSKTEPFK